jgi:hypothetical protein
MTPCTPQAGTNDITALDSRQDDTIVIGNSAGYIIIDGVNFRVSPHQINCLVVLPDNNIVFRDNSGLFYFYDTDKKVSRINTVSKTSVLDLFVARDGLIGCLTQNALEFFKPT